MDTAEGHRQAAYRRGTAGVFLIIAPLMLFVATALTTFGGDTAQEYLALVADNRAGEAASVMLNFFAWPLLVLGVLGALTLVSGRGATLANIGAFLFTLGGFFFMALFTSGIFDVVATAPDSGIDRAQYARLSENLEDSPLAIPVLVVALGGTLLGLVLFAVALLRARRVPVWVPAAIILGVVLVFVSGDVRALNLLANALLAIGFIGLGLQLVRPRAGAEERRAPAAGPPAQPA